MHRILIAIGIAVVFIGCGAGKTEGQKKRDALSDAVEDLRDQLSKAKTVLGSTISEYDATVNNKDGDMIGHYKKFNTGIDDVEKQVEKVRAANKNVEVKAQGVWIEWQAGINNINDDGLKKASQERMDAVKKKFEAIDKEGDEAGAAYEKLMKDLKNHRNFLGTGDINQESVKILAKDWPKMQENAKTVSAFIDKMVGMCNNYLKQSAMKVEAPKAGCGAGEKKEGCGEAKEGCGTKQ